MNTEQNAVIEQTEQTPVSPLFHEDHRATYCPELGLFDYVAMNPPFTMRADIRHILHARQFLKPGGRLAAVCLDTPERAAKLKHLCAEWIAIPAGTFKNEGTRVPTVLLMMQN